MFGCDWSKKKSKTRKVNINIKENTLDSFYKMELNVIRDKLCSKISRKLHTEVDSH